MPILTALNATNLQIITTVIAISGFLISLFNLMTLFLSNRKNVKIEITTAAIKNNLAILTLNIENHSRLPISICKAKIQLEDATFHSSSPVEKHIGRICETRQDALLWERDFFATVLPIELSCLGAKRIILLFEQLPAPVALVANSVTLSIYTNRGKIATKKYSIEHARHHKHPFA